MSKFIRRDGDLSAQPPYALEMTDVFLFVLEADSEKLQAMCDRELNLGPRRYSPMGDFVVLYGARIANLSTGTVLRTREIGIWVPVVAEDPDGNKELLTYSPYVWIDSSTSMHVGREVFGYTKLVGEVTLPDVGAPVVLRAHGDTLATRHGEASVVRAPILSIAPEQAATWARPAVRGPERWLELAKLFGTISHELVRMDPKPSVSELVSLIQGMRSVFLKQLPGPGPGHEADFQSLVEAAVVPDLSTLSGEALDGRWTVSLPDAYDEPRVVENLGLRGGTMSGAGAAAAYEVTALGQAWMEFEGVLESGDEVWRGDS